MAINWRRNLTFDKDPDSVLDYQMDFTNWLDSDTISSHTVIPETGLTLDSSSNDNTSVTAWVSGGTAGTIYTLTFRAVTNGGRTVDRTIRIRIREK